MHFQQRIRSCRCILLGSHAARFRSPLSFAHIRVDADGESVRLELVLENPRREVFIGILQPDGVLSVPLSGASAVCASCSAGIDTYIQVHVDSDEQVLVHELQQFIEGSFIGATNG